MIDIADNMNKKLKYMSKTNKQVQKYTELALKNDITGLTVTKVPYKIVNFNKLEKLYNEWIVKLKAATKDKDDKTFNMINADYKAKYKELFKSDFNYKDKKDIKVDKELVKKKCAAYAMVAYREAKKIL